jgi:GDP-4-dehydro-6-deoxy-D-mannose reductase
MRILLTGATGFAGSWLSEALLAQGGHQLAGLSLTGEWPPFCRHLDNRVPLFLCDLCDGPGVERILRKVEPQQIYHLAGYPHTGRSFKEPDAAWQGNLTATRTLFDAVHRWGGQPRILSVSSGLIYGEPREQGTILHEDSPLRPSSPYSVSKAAMDLLGYQTSIGDGLDIVRARPFNHFGPRQSPDFALPSFARQLAEIKRGLKPPVLETGDLSAQRDLTDVRDVASAYMLLMERGRRGEAYNVAGGTSRSMRAFLDELVRLAGIDVQIRVRGDLLRPTEPMRMNVSVDKLRAETGWQPRYSLEQTLLDILDFWSRNL